MLRMKVTLVPETGAPRDYYFTDTEEHRVTELADNFAKAVHAEQPKTCVNFELQESKVAWKNVQMSQETVDKLAK